MAQEITTIDWSAFGDDEAIASKLKELMNDIHVTSPEMRTKSTEEISKIIKDYIASRGFPTPIEVSLSEPNDIGQRMFRGIAHSPLTSQSIDF